MEKEKRTKAKKSSKKLSKGGIILIIGIIIILVPCLIFGGILLKASLETGSPINGNRFENDLDPAIKDSDIESIKNNILSLKGVENCEIVLTSAQLRVNVDVKDELTEDEIKNLTVEVFNVVNFDLPTKTYFTAADGKKMYDLAVNVYNFIDKEDENMIYYLLTKNSNMETFAVQCVSSALDEELASDLRGENIEETEDANAAS
ncbi:MAG: hypothetical protein Q4B60_05810 [Erysipelotrichaceae bacterium]|nr:hypothetical protein [Erysipelotrichaceae bacterium]